MAATGRQSHVRVSSETHRTLQQLSNRSGASMTALLDRAVECYRREQLFADAERAYRELESDPDALAELEAEYDLWDVTVADGLGREEW